MSILNLEFKQQFPVRANGKYEIVDICKYIAGFSNEDGGVVIYGIADAIKNDGVLFPDYVTGLSQAPSIEDLSQWVTGRVTPLVQSPAMRAFEGQCLQRHYIVSERFPKRESPACAYVEPPSNALRFFKKTAGGVRELKPEEIKELYWTAIIQQSEQIMRAGILRGMDVSIPTEDRFAKHKDRVIKLLEDPVGFGRLSHILCASRECSDSCGRAQSIPRTTARQVLRGPSVLSFR